MAYGSEGLSASDVALIQGSRTSNGDGMFGGDGAWWIVLFLIFSLGGFGNRGFGFGGNSGTVGDNYILATDMANLERKLDNVNYGIADSTFALNNTMTNGFANVQQTLCQGFNGVNQAITTQGYETRNSIFDLSRQLGDCCCQTQRAIDGINFNTQAGFNAIQNAMCLNTRDIIASQTEGFRMLHEELTSAKLEAKNERIQEQQNEINALRLKASQEQQTNYLISKLGQKCPEPAFIVPNPNCCYDYTVTRNSGCGCNGYFN